MILQALVEYYEALAKQGEIALLGWCSEKVSFALNISLDGELLGVIPLMHEVEQGKKKIEIPLSMEVPERSVRASGIKANFLCDNTTYILGFDDKGKPDRAIECFEACKKLHLCILENADGITAWAVKQFFLKWNPNQGKDHVALRQYSDKMFATNIVIKINGEHYAHQDDEIRQLWQKYSQSSASSLKQRCLVTGDIKSIAVLHGKIKGIPGAQSAGANLISFNARAYESYGKNNDESSNAPVSEYAAFAYSTALNHLLADREHRRQIGDTTVVYWAAQADPQPKKIFSCFAFPEPDTDSLLEGVMNNLAMGKPLDGVDMDERFYVLGLAPNAARISVRFFLQDNFGSMIKHLQHHYLRLEIQKPAFDKRYYLSVPALLWETVNPNSRDKASSPLLSGAVMHAVLTGDKYPQTLFGAVITRIRADGNVSRGRAAIIKAYLIHNQKEEEVTTMALNEQSNNRAYVLGRLFAVLEDAQLQASPNINSTIKDRYFTSACATPGSVFPQLLKLSNFHTTKAEYGKSKEIEKTKLLGKLDVENNPLPAHHSLQEQGIFILGYYHQLQARYTKKEEKNNDNN